MLFYNKAYCRTFILYQRFCSRLRHNKIIITSFDPVTRDTISQQQCILSLTNPSIKLYGDNEPLG
jgi:hypothetical protein